MDLLLVILGPVDPVFLVFLIPKYFKNRGTHSGCGMMRRGTKKVPQQILESIWEHLGKYYFSMSDKQTNWKSPTGKPMFWICFRFIFFCIYLLSIGLQIFLWRWGIEHVSFPLIKSTKALMWISYLSKTWTGNHPKLFYFQGWYPKLFDFQERESYNIN